MSLISDAQMKITDCWEENSNTILTVASLIGLGAALYFTARGAVKADRKIKTLEKEKENDLENLTSKDILKEAVPEYIPSLVAAAFTVACIISNHNINQEQKIALCSAYAALGSTYQRYKKTTRQIAGDEVADKIDILCSDRATLNIHDGCYYYNDDVEKLDEYSERFIFYDPLTDTFFESSIDNVRLAEYHLNRRIALAGTVTMKEFYQWLGIYDEVKRNKKFKQKLKNVGWDCSFLMDEYECPWVDFDHELVHDSKITLWTKYTGSNQPKEYYVMQPIIQPRDLTEYSYIHID